MSCTCINVYIYIACAQAAQKSAALPEHTSYYMYMKCKLYVKYVFHIMYTCIYEV